jgi:hypothetical protein
MQLRYLILILTLLFSLNVKAETWNCAIDSNVLTFARDRENEIFVGNGGFRFNYSENGPYIALRNSQIVYDIVSFNNFVINTVTFEITSYIYIHRLGASGNPNFQISRGNCRLTLG